MTAAVSVLAGMPVRRVVTTPDLPALETNAQMKPRVSVDEAFFAPRCSFGKLRDVDVIEMRTDGHADRGGATDGR